MWASSVIPSSMFEPNMIVGISIHSYLKRKHVSSRIYEKPQVSVSSIFYCLERVMGIEPTLSAWKAEVLPLNYTRSIKACT